MDDDLTSPKAAHDAVQELCDHVRHKAEEKAGKKFPEYTATSYRMRQNIVGASHSFIKVHVGGDEYVHLYIVKIVYPNAKGSLEGIEFNKTKDDPIETFERNV